MSAISLGHPGAEVAQRVVALLQAAEWRWTCPTESHSFPARNLEQVCRLQAEHADRHSSTSMTSYSWPRNIHRLMEMFKREYLHIWKSYVGKILTTALGSQTHSHSALKEVIFFLKIRFIAMIILNALTESGQRMHFTFHPNNAGAVWPLISISGGGALWKSSVMINEEAETINCPSGPLTSVL